MSHKSWEPWENSAHKSRYDALFFKCRIQSSSCLTIMSICPNEKQQSQLQDAQLGQKLQEGWSSVQSRVADPELKQKVKETATTGE